LSADGEKEGYLLVGIVGRARGLKGHVRVRPFTDDPQRFYDLKQVWIDNGSGLKPVAIAETGVSNGDVFLRFASVEDRAAAERLNGIQLYIRRQDAVELPQGSYFIVDIVGCDVEDGEGRFYGMVMDVQQSGAADVYMLSGGSAGQVLFPALRSVIVFTDTAARKIIVDAKRFKEVAVFEN
jgi:16S rRNA processing protein RimM